MPEFFIVNQEIANVQLRQWFDWNLFGVSLSHIGNKMIDKNIVVFRGSKNIEVDLSESFSAGNAKHIYNIYKFSYEEKHYSDKMEISRNVITIYLNTSEKAGKLNDLAPTIEKTIKSHFAAYIQTASKSFLPTEKMSLKKLTSTLPI